MITVAHRLMKLQVKHNVVNRKHFSIAATTCSESPSSEKTPTITSQGSFHLSSNTFQNILSIPFSPPPLPSSGEFCIFSFILYMHFKKLGLGFDHWLWVFETLRWFSTTVQHLPFYAASDRHCGSDMAHVCAWWVN